MENIIYKTLAECATLEVSKKHVFINHNYYYSSGKDSHWGSVCKIVDLENNYGGSTQRDLSPKATHLSFDRRFRTQGLNAKIVLDGPNDIDDSFEDIIEPIFVIGNRYYLLEDRLTCRFVSVEYALKERRYSYEPFDEEAE